MKTLIIFVCLTGFALSQQEIKILKQEQEISPEGAYSWNYETENGIQAQESGQLKAGSPEPILEAQGSYSYTGDDGIPISVQYIANENGFQPSGSHLPTPPPVPEAILRSLQYIASQPQQPQQQQPQIEERFGK